MLRENDINDFDLKVRSELENASLDAPRGVWRRVRREIRGTSGVRGLAGVLGTGRGSRGGFGAWGWALAAACCCLVLALGLWRPWSNKAVVPGTELAQIVPEKAVRGICGDETAANVPEEAVSPVCGDKIAQNVPGKAVRVTSGDEIAQNVPEEAVSPVCGDEMAATVPEKDVHTASGDETAQNVPSSTPDILESLRRQDLLSETGSKGNRRTAIFASGNLASNNTTSPAASWFGAQGEGSGALVKTGEETFGVPVEFGVGIKIPVAGRLSVGTGLSGSFLSSYYGANYDLCTGDVRHNMFYLGVPVNFYFNLVEAQSLTVYASAGGAAEYCLSNKYIFHADGGTVLPHIPSTEKFTRTISEPVNGFLFSVGAGIGVEFRINDLIGVYADPSFRYYFNSGHPTSVRTQRPQTFVFEAGIRFNL